MIPFLKKNLAPNRLAVYLTALAALAVALVGVLGQLSFQSTAAALGSLAVLGGVVAKWLVGWQQYEKAIYQQQLIQQEHGLQQAAVQAAQAVGKPGTGPKVTLPR